MPEWFNITAGIASILGLAASIAAWRQASTATKTAIETRREVAKGASMFDMAKFSSMIHELRIYLRLAQFEMANLRMRQLKDMLIELHEMPGFQTSILKRQIEFHQQTLGSDIMGIERQMSRTRALQMAAIQAASQTSTPPSPQGNVVNTMDIMAHLEDLSSFLVENAAKLKYS